MRAVALVVESEGDDGVDELPLDGADADLGPEGNGASHEPEGLAEGEDAAVADDAPAGNGDAADGPAGDA